MTASMSSVPAKPDAPHFGHTLLGQPVHIHWFDHMPTGGRFRWLAAVRDFNRWLAVRVTGAVGTMWCAYIFACIALTSLPSTLSQHSVNADVQWVAQTFLQLVLLSVIITGQNVEAEASDARQVKTLEYVSETVNLLRMDTVGGLKDLYDRLHDEIEALHGR